MTERQKVWEAVSTRGAAFIDATVFFDTNLVQQAAITINVTLTKPSLVDGSGADGVGRVAFDLTSLGGRQETFLRIHNPGETPLKAELVC